MQVKPVILFFTVFLLPGVHAYAQVSKATPIYYHISEKDGLADNLVNCFFQDSRGVMWMGTQNGLSCFDGSELKTWHANGQPSNTHLFDDRITGITEDNNRTLWITTLNGLSSFDLATKKIYSYQSRDVNNMRNLAFDGGRIWVATSDGLLEFDLLRKVFKRYLNKTSNLENITRFNNDCNNLLLDHKKRLWLATVNGLWRFDTSKKTFEQYATPEKDALFDGMVNTVFEDHAGKIWLGCWSRGLKQVDIETGKVQNFDTVARMPSHIMSVVEQHIGGNKYSMWLSGFLTEFKPTELIAQRHELKPIAEAVSLDPHCLYVSRDNLLWISTVKGVYILDPTRQLFDHYFIDQNTITDQNPAMFAQQGRLWVGGDKKFTFKLFDDNFNLVKDYTPAIRALKGEYANAGLAVMNITPYQTNQFLLSTTAGILIFNTLTGKTTVVCNSVSDSLVRATGFINNVVVNDNTIWCFPWRRGVWEFDPKLNRFHPLIVKLPESPGVLKNLNLQAAVKDKAGNLWITDLDYGVVKYTASTKKFERFITPDIPYFGRSLNISFIGDKIWLLANTNVVQIDPVNGKTKSWVLPPGMNKSIYDYDYDDSGNIWIATSGGLVVFNTHNHTFNQYTEEDGLINNDMNGALRKISSGRMVYAGENYLTSFKPSEVLHTPAKKELRVTEISTGDTDLLIANPKKIIVPPGTQKVTFKWALLNYTNPLQNRYYNKLEKIDNDWNYAGNQGKVEYNSLPPGEYKFRYRAITSDGLAGDEKELTFIVQPSFWQTWWFISLLLLLSVVGVLLIIRNVRIKERKKSALQLQLSALEMKALRAQMNPHFIFNALNSIQECIITKNTNTAYSYLSSFSKLVRMILENSEKQFISLEDELETLRLYLSIEKLRFDDTFEYKIQIAESVDTTFVRLPAMIVQPFVENALWHGLIHKKGEKKLFLSFGLELNNLVCVVRDNGVGRNHTTEVQSNRPGKRQSMGMKITEERLQLLETEASIIINDLKDDQGAPAGTEITIRIPLAY